MKCIAIILLYILISKPCFCQPTSWFIGAGAGNTSLQDKNSNGKIVTNSGHVGVLILGIDVPFHENLRTILRATIFGYKASFICAQLTPDSRYLQSYSINLNSISPDISFLYKVVNNKLKLYTGIGIDINLCWSNRNNYKMTNAQTGYIYRNEDNYLPLEPIWPSFNLRMGMQLGRWELSATGFIKGILEWKDSEIMNADLYFLLLGYHIPRRKKRN